MWQAAGADNPTTMVSYGDSAYVEFDFTGTRATILFSLPSNCNVSIDGGKAISYTVQDELTISAATSGTHTVRVHYGDKSAHMYFAGVRVPEGQTVSRTAEKPFYIQFIGDSVSDDPASFAHKSADLLGWDYSVIAGDSIGSVGDYFTGKYNFNTGYTPDIVFIFLGTDDLSSSSTQTDINDFVSAYKTLVANVVAKYGSDTKICAMQAISTSDASNMYNTSHPRYKAIEQVATELEALYGGNFNFIDAATVQSWGIEFNTATDATHPTAEGYAKLTSGVARYLFSAYVDQNFSFINHSFDISGIRKYNGFSWSGPDSTGNDNGIAYSHFNFTSSGHIITKEAALMPSQWEIAVVDLSQFANYTCNSDNSAYIRFTSTCENLDISFAAIVDDLDEAAFYLSMVSPSDTSYVLYENWAKAGVTCTLD